MLVNRNNPVTAPTVEVVTYEEAKLFLRLDQDEETELIEQIISAATNMVEEALGQQLITATYTGYLDAFPATDYIEMPYPPLQSITSLKYYDSAGSLQTYSSGNYSVITDIKPGRIQLGYGLDWPVTYGIPNAIQIIFACGYGAAASYIPANIIMAIKTLIHDMHQQRTTALEIPSMVYRLLWASSHGVL